MISPAKADSPALLALTRDDLLASITIGGGLLVVVLIVWIVLHHSRPELKIDIGIRGWINLIRPPREDPDDDVTPPE